MLKTIPSLDYSRIVSEKRGYYNVTPLTLYRIDRNKYGEGKG